MRAAIVVYECGAYDYCWQGHFFYKPSHSPLQFAFFSLPSFPLASTLHLNIHKSYFSIILFNLYPYFSYYHWCYDRQEVWGKESASSEHSWSGEENSRTSKSKNIPWNQWKHHMIGIFNRPLRNILRFKECWTCNDVILKVLEEKLWQFRIWNKKKEKEKEKEK